MTQLLNAPYSIARFHCSLLRAVNGLPSELHCKLCRHAARRPLGEGRRTEWVACKDALTFLWRYAPEISSNQISRSSSCAWLVLISNIFKYTQETQQLSSLTVEETDHFSFVVLVHGRYAVSDLRPEVRDLVRGAEFAVSFSPVVFSAVSM